METIKQGISNCKETKLGYEIFFSRKIGISLKQLELTHPRIK